MSELLVGSLVSVLTSVALWALLPRGIVLTRSVRSQDFRGQPMTDTWELRNDSALPIRIVSVTVCGPHTYDHSRNKIAEIDLPIFEGRGKEGASLVFDDETLEIRRTDTARSWRGIEIPPGDTLEAVVENNRTLRIRYRRAGRFGIMERREISIHGYV